MERDLASAYDKCRRMQRRYDPTYYWATRRLPAEVRPAVHAVYGFVRGADEIVDGPRRHPDPEARRRALAEWEGTLNAGLASGSSDHPVIAALVDAGERHDLDLSELGRYMRSMAIDCGPVVIGSWDELEDYMEGSAGSVGRIMAPLLGAPEPRARQAFGRFALGFQLANLVRDVREDHTLGRVYLPGLDPGALARAQATPEVRAVLRCEVQRARELLASGEEAMAAAAPRVRPGMRLARAVYEAVLDRVERNGFDVIRRRTSPPPLAVAGAAVRAGVTRV